MIVKLFKSGKSFKKLSAYLLHDAGKAETSERVSWTHTLNLANDDPAAAVDEMLWTWRGADDLKREAGIKPGGRPVNDPVRHFSLNWHPSQKPTREHMIKAVEGFLAHMGWQQHQALIVSHDDKNHPHVHVMYSAIDPNTGRALDSSFEKRRAQQWALAFEREQGLIFCEERVSQPEHRDTAPTRETWQRFKSSQIAFDRTEIERMTKTPDYFARHDAKGMNAREWEALKAHQKAQREQFFIDGKEAFRAVRKEVFREVREEFRGQWSAYYAARRHGDNPTVLAATKAALLDAQRKALDERRTTACDELRERRDQTYAAVLEQQRFDRTELGHRQQQGLRTYQLFDVVYPAPEPQPLAKQRDKSEHWHAPHDEHRRRAQEFERAARVIVDPSHQSGTTSTPASVSHQHQAGDTARKTDGVGRVLRETGPTAAASRPQVQIERKVSPRDEVKEVTEAVSEKQRATRAREITDRAAETDKAEHRIVRALWNRRRGRDGRD